MSTGIAFPSGLKTALGHLFSLLLVSCLAFQTPICYVWIVDNSCSSGLNKKKKEKKSRCSLSHCWTLSLLSSFQLFLQHMAFFDTASDKTKQIGMPQLSALQSHLFCTWTSVKACKCERQRDALFHARPPPSFDKTRKVFVLNRVLHVSDVLRDGRTAKIHPVLSAIVTGIKFLMSNIISIQSSYFSIYVTPLFFLPLESVESCS